MENKNQDEIDIAKAEQDDVKEMLENSKWINLMDTNSSQFYHQFFTDEKNKNIEGVISPTSSKPGAPNTVNLWMLII